MAFDYADLAATVAEVINEYGGEASVTQVAAGTYDPATGAVTSNSTTTGVMACVFDDETRLLDGTRLITGDKQVLMSGAIVPKPDDIFTQGTKVFRIIGVKELAPAGLNVLTEMVVRK